MAHQPRLIKDEQAAYQVDETEKAEYLERLRQKLKDPEFRQIEGFPIGEDEDILALSDPPYYTACPNPFLPEIIEQWQKEREQIRQDLGLPADGENGDYHREPFAADVSEGKNNPIYNAHSYHTKVPHKAIMRYILHYTDPGDIVFDGFCGTGMMGVAAQLCGNRNEVESLGYVVDETGNIFDPDNQQVPISQLGTRSAILNDLSPAATFIAYNYNTPADTNEFEHRAKHILQEVKEELGWMYETWHPHCNDPNRIKGEINNIIWSDIFNCPNCSNELVFWDIAVSEHDEKILDKFKCTYCAANLTKSILERSMVTTLDAENRQPIKKAKQAPVLINYSVGKKRFKKNPDVEDMKVLERTKTHQQFPTPNTRIDRDIDIWYERDYRSLGVYSVNDFYTQKNLTTISFIWHKLDISDYETRTKNLIRFCLTAVLLNMSKMNRWPRLRGPLTGTLYIPSIFYEINPILTLNRRIKVVSRAMKASSDTTVVGTRSLSKMDDLGGTFDYIFTDPPFGSNIIYSDLSVIWESWLKSSTDTSSETVVHRRKKQNNHRLTHYADMMSSAFKSMYVMLKSGRWITVEFHNTRNAVWNVI